MDSAELETDRLILRKFGGNDMEALYLLMSDVEVNTFLPWFPVKSFRETEEFYESRIAGEKYCYAVCLKEDGFPIGYVKADTDESHDLGYALRREFRHRGIATEAGRALVGLLRDEGFPYVTATHDRNNPKSGEVMRRLGMKYRYSYMEQWQPKNFSVVFRLYQLNLDGREDRTFQKYRDIYPHFIEDI